MLIKQIIPDTSMEFSFDEENRIIIGKATGERYVILPTFRLEQIFKFEYQTNPAFSGETVYID